MTEQGWSAGEAWRMIPHLFSWTLFLFSFVDPDYSPAQAKMLRCTTLLR